MRTTHLLRASAVPSALLALLLPAAVQAAEPGFYVGGKVGAASVEGDFIDDDDTSYGAYAGYQFTPNFALEGVYTNFGNVDIDVDDLEVDSPGGEPDSIGLRGIGMVPVGERFDLLGAIGWHSFDLNPDSGEGLRDALGDSSSTDLFYGIGAQYNFRNSLALRVMYDRYEFRDWDADEISLGLHWTF